MRENELHVWFYRIDRGEEAQWVWHRAHSAPVVGDFIVTPANSRWVVVGRTWVEGDRCNVTVRDLAEGEVQP